MNLMEYVSNNGEKIGAGGVRNFLPKNDMDECDKGEEMRGYTLV